MHCIAMLVSGMLLSHCILLGLATATHILAPTGSRRYDLPLQMVQSPTLTSVIPSRPSETCSKDDAFRDYEDISADLLLDVQQGEGAPDTNSITESGDHMSRTHTAILVRPLHALCWCSRKDDVSAGKCKLPGGSSISAMSSLENDIRPC